MKKYINYFKYLRIVRIYKNELNIKLKLRVDYIGRLYTVVNLTQKNMDDIKLYGPKVIDGVVNTYIKDVDKYSMKIGLSELLAFGRYEIINPSNILLIFEYKDLNVPKIINRILYTLLLGIISIILYKLKLFNL